jgi:hypothetical protein
MRDSSNIFSGLNLIAFMLHGYLQQFEKEAIHERPYFEYFSRAPISVCSVVQHAPGRLEPRCGRFPLVPRPALGNFVSRHAVSLLGRAPGLGFIRPFDREPAAIPWGLI